MRFLLFTDLDGTLLDHHTYKATVAQPALDALREAGIPVIFCSSKTFEEQRFYQQELGIHAPFIIENGSAICIPEGYFPGVRFLLDKKIQGFDLYVLAKTEAHKIRTTLDLAAASAGLEIKGFASAPDAELSQATGLPNDALARLRTRWFTETLLMPAAQNLQAAEALRQKIAPEQLSLVRGGRFWTVQSNFAGKGFALRRMAQIFEQVFSRKIPSVAIGDSQNDLSMLAVAERSFLVKKPNGTWSDIDLRHIRRTNQIGPAGFAEAVWQMLETHYKSLSVKQ